MAASEGDRRGRAEELFASWLAQNRSAAPEAFEAFVERHRELEDELRAGLAAWRLVARLVGAEDPHTGPSVRDGGAEPSSREVHAGERVADYLLVRRIGRGGMGEVWEAEQTSLGRRVALKLIRPERVSERAHAFFEREARAGGRLGHPGIVMVHDHGEDRGLAWIAMELVEDAWTLRDILDELASDGELPGDHDRNVARFVIDVADAMEAAHSAGVVHRDLKPQNVLVGPDQRPRVTDFGLARITDETALSESGALAGTYYYMSPEQVAGDRIDHRTDVFSLGVVLYEMLTLRRPFEGDTAQQIAFQLATLDPPDPRSIRSRVPLELSVIAGKALEKDPGRRYDSMRELAADLRRFLAHEPIIAREPGRLRALEKWARRHPVLASAGAIAFLASVTIAVLLVQLLRRGGELELSNDELRTRGEELVRSNQALDAALADADARREQAERRRVEVERLSALQDLDRLVAEADALWPAVPAHLDDYSRWIAQAEELLAELPTHRETLQQIRARARERTAEEIELDRAEDPRLAELATLEPTIAELERRVEGLVARGAASRGIASAEARLDEARQRADGIRSAAVEPWRWRFDDRSDRWWHAELERLIARLQALADEEAGLLAYAVAEPFGWGMLRRLEFAEALEERSLTSADARRRWDEAIAGVAASPRYGGLRLAPQLGLVPLGADPASGLWEFAHLMTGWPPERGADGRLVRTEETGLVFVLIPGGTFWMGAQSSDPTGPNYDPMVAEDEVPVHEVRLSPYFISKYEMTQAQWLAITGTNPSRYQLDARAPTLLHPVEQVSWFDCERVLRRLGLELPSEAQWERAARGGSSTPWWTGVEKESLIGTVNLADGAARRGGAFWTSIADWLEDGAAIHAEVGTYPPNGFGLHEVVGNVTEWCRDGYHGGIYRSERPIDPVAPASHLRVARGAAFDGPFNAARSADRDVDTPDSADSSLGLRPVRRVEP